MSGDNQSENKFMSMLERRGIVRKVSLDDDSPAAAHVGTARLESDPPPEAEPQPDINSSPYEKELNSLLEQADASIAATQEQLDSQQEQIVSTQVSEVPAQHQQPAQFQSYAASPEPTVATTDYSPGYAAQAHPVEPIAQSAAYDETPAFEPNIQEATPRDAMFSWMGDEDVATEAPQTVDSSTQRYLDVEELYEVLSLRSKKTDTIYLIEDYLKSIPDTLPDESRRQIVTKIVAASGFDYDLLMGDGILRVKMLKEYAEKFARHTDDYVEARMAEISSLENELARIQELIDNRRELHKKQFLSIEAEAGRLREILTFING